MPPVVDEKDKAAADKKAADAAKAEASRAGANEAAQSVADAVKRVADAAVAEVQKTTPVAQQDFSFDSRPGVPTGRFTIRGKGFSSGGTVLIGGAQALTTEWGNEYIAGRMPEGVKTGPISVEVVVDSATRQTGAFRV